LYVGVDHDAHDDAGDHDAVHDDAGDHRRLAADGLGS
jgi:hypothetical protein